jgi:hypothetical protein
MVQTLYGNAASLTTTLGGGAHGHIGLIMTDTLYATLTATPYVTPIDPGVIPLIPNNASTIQCENRRIDHKEARRIFDNHTNMEDALKAQVIDTIDDRYICEIRNKYTGYLGISTCDLLDHLLDRYGKITATDLEANKKQMNEPLDSTQKQLTRSSNASMTAFNMQPMVGCHTPPNKSYRQPTTPSAPPDEVLK